jgi:hypothetical protein
MKIPRRQFLHLAAGAAALRAASRMAWAQTYPSRPITMVVGFAAGGATDTIGRMIAERMKSSSAIEGCRTAALGGHVARCENEACGHTVIAYNSCLMGKFRNGELATSSAAILAGIRMFLGRSISCLLSITTKPPRQLGCEGTFGFTQDSSEALFEDRTPELRKSASDRGPRSIATFGSNAWGTGRLVAGQAERPAPRAVRNGE